MTSLIPQVSHLSKCVIRVLGCNPGPMTLQGTNTYIIGTGKSRVLLDTGEPSNEEYIASLSSVLREEQIKINTILVSHWHSDHIGGLSDVLKCCSDPLPTVMKFRCVDGPGKDVDAGNMKFLGDGDEIKVEGATLRAIHTPGHTRDHVIVRLSEENAVFSGDCILGEGTTVFEDLSDYMKSLKVILGLSPSVIYPGHGPVISDPLPKIQMYLDHRMDRESQIMAALGDFGDREAVSPMDLVKTIYKDTPEHLHAAASVNVTHHLQKLLKEGKVVQADGQNKWRIGCTSSSL